MSVGGTWGKVLHVDLKERRHWIEEITDDVYLKLAGGRALAAYLLLTQTPAGVEPLGPENLLIFAPGILQGTALPGSGRHGVAARSPLTGGLASSEAGGWWGYEFKRTGHDAMVIHGQADQPVYLWLNDGSLEIRPAGHLWGQDAADVEEQIRSELADQRVRVAQCGVAGENMVLFANVIHDSTRAAGRNGLGAVMGSKLLKAVAVRGSQTPHQMARERTAPVAKWLADTYGESMAWLARGGTPGSVASLNASGALPTRNFRDSAFEGVDGISGELMHHTILVKRDTCHACPVHCKHVVAYQSEGYPEQPSFRTSLAGQVEIDPAYGGPEYESLGALGSTCGVDDLVAVAKANELAARWGLDTISLGMTIAFTMECVERGLLLPERTGGFAPRWGNAGDLLAAVEMIAHRRGFGDQMAMGSRRLAAWIGGGAEQFTVEVKGQELPMHEPRLKAALGIGYAVAPVGADHMMNIHDTGYTRPGAGLERVGEVAAIRPLPASDLSDEKMALFFHEVNFKHFMDCGLLCQFYPYDYRQMAEALSGITGHEFGPRDVLAVGERAQHLARLYNLREGFTADDDRLPKRVMKAFAQGPLAGIEITPAAFLAARSEWYRLMGWTPTGVPGSERMRELGLAELLHR